MPDKLLKSSTTFGPPLHSDGAGNLSIRSTEPVAIRNFYATLSGDDSNSGTEASPFRTLEKLCVTCDTPGDWGHIGAGTWVETATLPHNEGGSATMAVRHAGTALNPIVFKAADGYENDVILDSQVHATTIGLGNIGITLSTIAAGQAHYTTLRNLQVINNEILGIAGKSDLTNPALGLTGVTIDGCYIFNTNQPSAVVSSNISSIRMNGAVDWLIKNTKMEQVYQQGVPAASHTECIETYAALNCIVENCDLSVAGVGIMSKNHYPVLGILELTARNNLYHDLTQEGFFAFNNGTGTPAVRHIIVSDSIFRDTSRDVRLTPVNADAQSHNFELLNNILDMTGQTSECFVNNSYAEFKNYGNIFIHATGKESLNLQDNAGAFSVDLLTESDYNVYEGTFRMVMDAGGPAAEGITTLAAWQAKKAVDFVNLAFDDPDPNSVNPATGTVFTDRASGDYSLKAGSAAIGLLPGGVDAGPAGIVGLTGGGAYE